MGKGKSGAKGNANSKAKEKKAQKIVEDKTFGLKNKNKSKKVQQYIAQVSQSARGGAGRNNSEAMAAQRKKEKEAQKQAEREMLALFGDVSAINKKKAKKMKEKEKAAKAEEEAKTKEQQAKADAKDFGIPICALRDVFGQGSKVTVERVCVLMTWKDNLPGKAFDGSPCLYIKVTDGTTLNPMTFCMLGETPTSFTFKVNQILDIRGAVAMVRGNKVMLEIPKGAAGLSSPDSSVPCSVEIASDRLAEFVQNKIKEEEEIRERGGIPIEERIEEERAQLKAPLTPITKESFMAWKEKKRKRKEEEAAKKAKEGNKKSGGKQLLSGKDLFHKNRELFVDDDGTDAPVDDTNAEKGDEKGDDAVGETTAALQEKLYLDGDDLDDLDDLDDEDDEN
mmetsp:Transcript_2083/g.3963  ORF Transcript_2083/g.3963 Transcript_2083/m.3963 type:complete len:394 (-) Transcript_2083:97-1278(-)|eukprot:CAMPEP_0184526560 /NCGR_PEP_ID=MMETSP0198_2-20121128/10721_1 /TAXON_ID=1112570 /ORGANISM="Thraustochytrium sp., Strain LLF1b" /LENGTH=393 /DNA_ID=CAMNT_0026918143 /DNA_START=239 /DNA_END=1420 /DNA_ORIENTATION=-